MLICIYIKVLEYLSKVSFCMKNLLFISKTYFSPTNKIYKLMLIDLTHIMFHNLFCEWPKVAENVLITIMPVEH